MNLFERVVAGNLKLIMAPFMVAEKLLEPGEVKSERERKRMEEYNSLSEYEKLCQDSRNLAKAMRAW